MRKCLFILSFSIFSVTSLVSQNINLKKLYNSNYNSGKSIQAHYVAFSSKWSVDSMNEIYGHNMVYRYKLPNKNEYNLIIQHNSRNYFQMWNFSILSPDSVYSYRDKGKYTRVSEVGYNDFYFLMESGYCPWLLGFSYSELDLMLQKKGYLRKLENVDFLAPDTTGIDSGQIVILADDNGRRQGVKRLWYQNPNASITSIQMDFESRSKHILELRYQYKNGTTVEFYNISFESLKYNPFHYVYFHALDLKDRAR